MTNLIHIACPACQAKNRIPAAKLGARPTCGVCKAQLLPEAPFDIDEAQLNKHLKNDELPLLVDFWAPWCGPCRMMAPEFAKAAKSLEGRARFAKINTQDHPKVSERLRIQGIPLLILYHKGREIGRLPGARPAADIARFVTDKILALAS